MKTLAPCAFAAVLGFLLAAQALAEEPGALASLKREAIAEIDAQQRLTQQMVDSIFSFSELGFQEFETSKYVTGILEENGFALERGVAGIPTAWVASYGSGKPVIGFITDIDCIPRASQKPGVAYRAPLIEGAPGHGEGHNSGMAVNVTAALALKSLMRKHVRNSGLVSVQYFFHGRAAHSAVAPWSGRSALDAVELMIFGASTPNTLVSSPFTSAPISFWSALASV